MAVKLAFNRVEQFCDGNGNPYVGAKLFTYVAGSVGTKQTTYTESTGSTPNTNPIVLDANGQLPQPVWLTTGVSYKFVLAPSTDTDPPGSPLWTLDNITGINDSSSSQSEWIASGFTPTFISASQFSVSGDQTTAFAKSRRVKATVTAGTVYGTITASSFGGGITTVTLALDSGALDSGLSAVSYGIVAAANPSIDADMVHRKGAAVASAATTDIWSIAGDIVHVTGTTTITSFGTAPYAGAERTLIFDAALVITHSGTTVQCLGGRDTPVQAGDRVTVRADTTANIVITSHTRALVNSVLLEIAQQGRLTLTPAVPVTTSDVTGATTVYFSPMAGRFTELSQATTDNTKSPAAVANSSNYDMFLWMDSGTMRCTRGPAWTSDTARGTGAGTSELTTLNGLRVNANAVTNGPAANAGIYVGTIRSDGSAQINDALAKRHVWNMYNRLSRPMRVTEATVTWTYTTDTLRQARATTSNQLDYVQGLSEDQVKASVEVTATNAGATVSAAVGIGLDSTTADSSNVKGPGGPVNQGALAAFMTHWARYAGFPGIGRHTLVWLERSGATSTTTWTGSTTYIQSGIYGELPA